MEIEYQCAVCAIKIVFNEQKPNEVECPICKSAMYALEAELSQTA